MGCWISRSSPHWIRSHMLVSCALVSRSTTFRLHWVEAGEQTDAAGVSLFQIGSFLMKIIDGCPPFRVEGDRCCSPRDYIPCQRHVCPTRPMKYKSFVCVRFWAISASHQVFSRSVQDQSQVCPSLDINEPFSPTSGVIIHELPFVQ
jgi:hypothetical protein